MMDLVEQAQNNYWDYVFSIEDMKVKQESVQLAEKTLEENQMKVAAGVMRDRLRKARDASSGERVDCLRSTGEARPTKPSCWRDSR